jgi:hypothetical protein
MNAPSVDIKTILEANSSLGLALGTNLFISEMPIEPNECAVIYDTGGYDPEADYNYERPTIQIRIRGNKGEYVDANTLAQDIRDELHGTVNETIDGARYVGIWCEGDVNFIAYDDNQRPEFSVNFRIHRTSTS